MSDKTVCKVNGVRFHNRTGEPTIVELPVELRNGECGNVIHFGRKGVTGHEGYYIANLLRDRDERRGNGIWLNAGTRGRWDSLFLSWELLDKAIEACLEAAK